MTNRMIIYLKQVELLKQGVLHTTGNKEVICIDGEYKGIDEIQPIHTYAAWKSLGYQVRKGEKAIAKFPVWKYIGKSYPTSEELTDEMETQPGRMYMKMSAFFTDEQVEPISDEV